MDSIEEGDDREYDIDDGLGDLLKDQQPSSFSWAKTLLVLALIVLAVFVTVGGVFKVWSLYLNGNNTTQETLAEPDLRSESDDPSDPDKKQEKKNFKKKPKQAPKRVKTGVKPESLDVAYKVIVGSFSSRRNAVDYVKKMKSYNVDSFVRTYHNGKRQLYVVQVGSFNDRQVANRLVSQLKKRSIDAYLIKI